ncbi:MAG: deoxyribonuclease V [Geminicoccaceae bacterium]|nr:deoxyribonuclease V [Geminicoccaceae bacterium]
MRKQPEAATEPARRPTSLPASGGPWPTSPAAARALQEELARRVIVADDFAEIRWVGGLDVHYAPRRGLAWAAAVVVDATTLELVASALACAPLVFPYVPGLLSFREAPAALAALARLRPRPDLVLVDGQGRAHPRRFGLACHIGVLADLPTIGVAKSRLLGEHAAPPEVAGGWVPLYHGEEVIGAVVRTRVATTPLFVSVGHRISLARAIDWTIRLCAGRRLPEPIRLADRLSRAHPD